MGLYAELEDRLSAWEARHAEAEKERDRLHAALRGFGSKEVAEEIIGKFGSLHVSDRKECRIKLRELQTEVLATEASDRQRLCDLYEQTGSDTNALELFFAALDEELSGELRQTRLVEEVQRFEDYSSSVQSILQQLDELKTLVLEGSRFEAAAAAEKDRFAGKSLHFLEEEQFRKSFARRYPQLRDGLLRDLEAWESSSGVGFVYRGAQVRAQL